MSDSQSISNSTVPVTSKFPPISGDISPDTFIGISDPGISDTLFAVNQAYCRAVFMYALQQGKGRGMTDFFQQGNQTDFSTNYEELCELNLKCNLALSQCSIEHYRLASGEIVVLLTVNKRQKPKNVMLRFDSRLEIYSKEIEMDGNNQSIARVNSQSRLQFLPSDMTLTDYYLGYADSRGRLMINSSFNGANSDFERYRYFYHTDNDEAIQWISPELKGSPVYQGLWYALLSNITQQFSNHFQNEQVRIKKVGDSYQSKLINMNRETNAFDFRLKVQNIALRNDSLFVNLNN